jgi:type I restriction enzyme S subunit
LVPEYALHVFLAYLHNKRFQKVARWTVNIAHLGADRFSQIEFPLPSEDEQREIVQEVAAQLSAVDQLRAQFEANLKRAARLRQAILKRAFEGRLVPQDPTDEPAEKLLERIRREREGSIMTRAAKARSPHNRELGPGSQDLLNEKG